MKIDRTYKLEKAVSGDELRPAINYILLEDDHAIATNGHILAKVPIERNGESDGLLNPAAITTARKYQKSDNLDISMQGNSVTIDEITRGDSRTGNFHIVPRLLPSGEGETFPDWKSVVPELKQVHKVGLNVNNLKALAEAIGADTVVLEMEAGQPHKGIIVRPVAKHNKAEGLLMPCRINEHLEQTA
jgi:hypothetical protein